MKIFLDSANLDEIKKVKEYGILDGVTTNPTLIKKALDKQKNTNLEKYIKEILKVCKGKPVSLEVTGTNYKDMVKEGKNIFKKFNPTAKNVYIKIPINPCEKINCEKSFDGIKAIKELTKNKIPVNATLIITPEQAVLAAKAGAKFVSPFIGRINDYLIEKRKKNDEGIISGIDGIKKISIIFKQNKIKTEILAASIRNRKQFREALENGADIVTIPYKTILEILNHEKTVEGIKKFKKDTIKEYQKLVTK